MDSFFGIGLPELLVILLIASMVMGPHRIRQVARTLGRITAQLQGISREFARQLNAELDALDSGEVKDAVTDVSRLQEEVAELRRELSQVPKSLSKEGRVAVQDGEAAMKKSQISQNNQQPEPEPESEADESKSTRLPRPIEVADDPE
jgi:Sec-independent protein translocase protein TatA